MTSELGGSSFVEVGAMGERIPSFFWGPTAKQQRTWLRQGSGWWVIMQIAWCDDAVIMQIAWRDDAVIMQITWRDDYWAVQASLC